MYNLVAVINTDIALIKTIVVYFVVNIVDIYCIKSSEMCPLKFQQLLIQSMSKLLGVLLRTPGCAVTIVKFFLT